MLKKLLRKYPLVTLFFVSCLAIWQWYSSQDTFVSPGQSTNQPSIDLAIAQKMEDVQVKGSGEVYRLLADDLKGSKHQRILLKHNNNQTLLIVHNIDLAPRINNIRVGDTLEFFGEYIWNDKGGLVHWTHHDPNGKHIGGWLKHDNKTYQ